MRPAQQLIEKFDNSALTYGDDITHNQLREWSGLELPITYDLPPSQVKKAMDAYNFMMLTAVEALKEYALTERKMLLKSVRGVGYTILMPECQVETVVIDNMSDIKKSLKRIETGVENVNLGLLDQHQRAHRSSVKARLSGLSIIMGSKGNLLGPDK